MRWGLRRNKAVLPPWSSGAWRMRIKSDETGAIQTEVGVYREIREPELLSFTPAWVRSNGTLTHPTLVTATFSEKLLSPRLLGNHYTYLEQAACFTAARTAVTALAGWRRAGCSNG